MKLVRDGTPAILAEVPLKLTFTPADPASRRQLLFGKLLEEALEWLSAASPEQAAKELADMQGLLWELCEVDDISVEQVLGAATLKRAARGSHANLTIMRIAADEEGEPAPVSLPIRADAPNASLVTTPASDAFSGALGNRRGSDRPESETPEPETPEPEAGMKGPEGPPGFPVKGPAPRSSSSYLDFDGPGYSG